MTVAPAALAWSATFLVFSSMSVDFITVSTAPCRAPPSEVKSFWNSMRTTAVDFGSDAIAVLPSGFVAGSPGRSRPHPTTVTQRGGSHEPGVAARWDNRAHEGFGHPGRRGRHAAGRHPAAVPQANRAS